MASLTIPEHLEDELQIAAECSGRTKEELAAMKEVNELLTVKDPAPQQPDPVRIEILILYESPQLDGDESALEGELEKQPW